MGPVLGVSVADLYSAAFGPGFLLAGIYLVYLVTRSFLNPKLGPPVPKEERVTDILVIAKEVVIGVLPLLLLITATLGSILAGLATPTEASGIGALGALILAVVYRRLTFAGLKQAVVSATLTSSMVLLLAVTSNIFGAVFARMGTANWVTDAMVSLPVPGIVMLAFVIVLIFLLGWPFEWPAIILVFLPIFYPVVDALRPELSKSLGIPEDLFMASLEDSLQGRPFAVLAVNVGEGPSAARDFGEKMALRFPLLLDRDMERAEAARIGRRRRCRCCVHFFSPPATLRGGSTRP